MLALEDSTGSGALQVGEAAPARSSPRRRTISARMPKDSTVQARSATKRLHGKSDARFERGICGKTKSDFACVDL